MKTIVNTLLILFVGVLGWQFFNLYAEHFSLSNSAEKINTEISSVKAENENLKSDIEYFSDPQNQEKELKSKANYKDPGEKMIIIVPPKDSQNGQ